jgi:hypothetical protein
MRPSKFIIVLMVVAVVASLYVAFGPLLREALARHTWDQVPCHLYSTGRFVFEYKGVRYTCARPNMWDVKNGEAFPATVTTDFSESNATCYVNGKTPPIAVLRLDAYKHLDGGIGNYASASLLLLVAAGFAVADYRRRKARKPST